MAVTYFNAWLEFANAKIVVSSNWVTHTSKEQLQELFKLNGLIGEMHEDWATPKKFTSNRYHEINRWLDDHPEVDNYLIVEDDSTLHGLVVANTNTVKWSKSIIRKWKRRAKLGELPVSGWDKMELERAQEPHIHKMAGRVIEVDFADGISLKQFRQGCDMLQIDGDDIAEKWYGVKKLTPEEKVKAQKERDELLKFFI